MEDMWKSRRAPKLLVYDEIQKEASYVAASVAAQDQRIWTLAENLAVFSDRYLHPLKVFPDS